MKTKNEIYTELQDHGVELKSISSYSKSDLEEIYLEHFNSRDQPEPVVEDQPEPVVEKDIQSINDKKIIIRPLVFCDSGWCSELGKSYFRGTYSPSSEEEYLALKKYAKEEL